MRFAHAMGEDHVPSTGRYSPHIHIFFEMEDGSSIAFFEVPKDPGNVKDMESPDWIQHFAMEVDKWRRCSTPRRAGTHGLSVVGPTNHDDFILSIYFFDPSGHRLELTARTAPPIGAREFEAEAPKVLEAWEGTHDWSQRAELFGAETGYSGAARGGDGLSRGRSCRRTEFRHSRGMTKKIRPGS